MTSALVDVPTANDCVSTALAIIRVRLDHLGPRIRRRLGPNPGHIEHAMGVGPQEQSALANTLPAQVAARPTFDAPSPTVPMKAFQGPPLGMLSSIPLQLCKMHSAFLRTPQILIRRPIEEIPYLGIHFVSIQTLHSNGDAG